MGIVKAIGGYLLARFGEASTWASLIAWVSAEIGIKTNADFNMALVHVALAFAALAGVLLKEGWQVKLPAR